MSEEEKRRHNAHRLAGVLHDYAADPAAVSRLAPLLAYNREQLQTDMRDLIRYIWELEEREES